MTDARYLKAHLPDLRSKLVLMKDGMEAYKIKNSLTGTYVIQVPHSPLSVYFDEIVPQDCNNTAMLVRNGEITARIPDLCGYTVQKEKLNYWE